MPNEYRGRFPKIVRWRTTNSSRLVLTAKAPAEVLTVGLALADHLADCGISDGRSALRTLAFGHRDLLAWVDLHTEVTKLTGTGVIDSVLCISSGRPTVHVPVLPVDLTIHESRAADFIRRLVAVEDEVSAFAAASGLRDPRRLRSAAIIEWLKAQRGTVAANDARSEPGG